MTIYTEKFTSTKPAPYVYRLDNPVTGEFYIGYRSANKVLSDQDLGFKYFTSSKYVKPRFHEFNITILAEFFDHKAAYTFENLLIFEAWGDPLLLNKHHRHGKVSFDNTDNKASAETKQKISLARLGKSRMSPSDETKQKISLANLGKTLSEEHKQKISIAGKGKTFSEEHKLKLSTAKTGVTLSEDHKLKISVAKKGKSRMPFSDETKQKMSMVHLDKSRMPHSDETKLKMSIAKKGIPKQIITCPHCLKSGGINIMNRWHFDNCK